MSKIKSAIMEVMESHPNEEMTVTDIAKLLSFQAYSTDVHIRQLYALGRIERPSRGVYMLRTKFPPLKELKQSSLL